MTDTAVVVLVPAADPAFTALRRTHDPSGADGLGCHVTIMSPFLDAADVDDATVKRLGRALAATPPFTVRMGGLARFTEEMHALYATVDPTGPFVAMTRAVGAEFGLEPYGGIHEEIVPHLTIGISEDPAVLDRIAPIAEAALPITGEIGAVDVVFHEPAGWRTAHSIRLG
jgi:2'-5' RNA ligase